MPQGLKSSAVGKQKIIRVDMMMLARRKEWVYYDTNPNYGHLASKMGS